MGMVMLFFVSVNQGPTRAFRNVKEYVDGYENVGAQLVDFKNFGRDIKCFIGDWDAQLFVNYFEDKRDTTEGFYFAYEVDSGKCLVRAFWCDAESRRNYALFGDYITYDPTYSTNKYCMLFTPFTGVDHHKRSVTFASALLFHEDEDSFTWVFQKFLDAMGQREPHCIITDRVWNKAGKRRKWIPAYFRDVPMGCLLRTTQRSESQNNFFKRFENAHGTLVEFLMRFSSRSFASICSLSVGGFTPPANGVELIGIADARTQKTYQVVYNSLTNDAECSCKLFNGKGIISRHII
ncbi:protein FAR1-RELATED SEQUENCE 5-like [Silene latifolia]|uniref:protein FAR1-RELATED SEQUENCE 5-like n=1 Tax=Silene latifolia TaxID=37657 RepID=UPI003D776F28